MDTFEYPAEVVYARQKAQQEEAAERQRLRAENARLRAERDIYLRALIDVETQFGKAVDVDEVTEPAYAKAEALTSPCPGFEIADGTNDYSGCIAAERTDGGLNDCPSCGPSSQEQRNG